MDLAPLIELTLIAAAIVSVLMLYVAWATRRASTLQRARAQAIAALCAKRGLLPGAVPWDFGTLGANNPGGIVNSFSSPDHQFAVADFSRLAGKHVQFFSLLAIRIDGLDMPYLTVVLRRLTGITVGGPPVLELESTEFDKRFSVRSKDRRSAVMLLDPAMMQLLLDCEEVNFEILGDKVVAFVYRAAEPAHQPTEPVEFELLFKFWDGFVARMPDLLRTEYTAPN